MKIDLNETEYQSVLDAVLSPNDYILVADAERCIRALNRAPFGCEMQGFLGRDFIEFAPPAHHLLIMEAAERIRDGAPPAELEIQGNDARWYRMRIVGNMEQGAVQGYAVYLLDIDDAKRKEAERANLRAQLEHGEATLRHQEDELRQLQKMEALGTLAGTIAHEFNNLLQVMINGCTSVLLASSEDSQAARQIQPVIRAAQRGVSLTRQLLSFSRRKGEPIGAVDLDAQLSDMAVLLAFLLGSGVSLELEPKAGCEIRAEAGLIQQVLINLALNARDAMPQGGILRVSTLCREISREEAALHAGLEPGLHAQLSVRDTGIGMDQATRARIFDPFFTTKGAGKGTGLGLSTVYAIVKQLNGHIDVESAPGRGTAFHLYFPSLNAGS